MVGPVDGTWDMGQTSRVRAKSCTINADCAACLLAHASHGACKGHKAASQLQSDTLPDWRRHTLLFRTFSLQRLSAQAPLSSRDSQARVLASQPDENRLSLRLQLLTTATVERCMVQRAPGDRAAPLSVAYLEVRWLQVLGQ